MKIVALQRPQSDRCLPRHSRRACGQSSSSGKIQRRQRATSALQERRLPRATITTLDDGTNYYTILTAPAPNGNLFANLYFYTGGDPSTNQAYVGVEVTNNRAFDLGTSLANYISLAGTGFSESTTTNPITGAVTIESILPNTFFLTIRLASASTKRPTAPRSRSSSLRASDTLLSKEQLPASHVPRCGERIRNQPSSRARNHRVPRACRLRPFRRNEPENQEPPASIIGKIDQSG